MNILLDNGLARHIPYPDFRHLEDFHAVAEQFWTDEHHNSAYSFLIPMWVQKRRGVLLSVEKNLSDELMETDLKNLNVEDVVMPFPSLEVAFLDPNLPSILFYSGDDEFYELAKQFVPDQISYIREGRDKLNFCLDYYTKEGVAYTIRGTPEILNPWVHEDEARIQQMCGFLDATDKEPLSKFLLRLVVKVLIYASIPQYKPREIIGRKSMKRGEKPIVGRPKTRVFRASLPPVIVSERHETSDSTNRHNTPHRRRGHLRKLTSERFTKKRGQLIYIRPTLIHGGSLDDRIYEAKSK